MYRRTILLAVALCGAAWMASSCQMSGEAKRASHPSQRAYTDDEWLAMARQCEHQPKIVWKGNTRENLRENGWSVGLEGLAFYNTPASVLESQLSDGLLTRRPGLFLPLLEAQDPAVVLTGIYAYGHRGHFEGKDLAAIKAGLRGAMDHDDTRVRCSALEVLACKHWLGVDDVRRGLQDDALIVRNLTASFLSIVASNEQTDRPAAETTAEHIQATQHRLAPILLDHLNDGYFYIRVQCAGTLLAMLPPSERPPRFAWDRADWDSRVAMQQEWKAWWAQHGPRVASL